MYLIGRWLALLNSQLYWNGFPNGWKTSRRKGNRASPYILFCIQIMVLQVNAAELNAQWGISPLNFLMMRHEMNGLRSCTFCVKTRQASCTLHSPVKSVFLWLFFPTTPLDPSYGRLTQLCYDTENFEFFWRMLSALYVRHHVNPGD